MIYQKKMLYNRFEITFLRFKGNTILIDCWIIHYPINTYLFLLLFLFITAVASSSEGFICVIRFYKLQIVMMSR